MTYPLRPFLGEVSVEEPPLWSRSTVFAGLGGVGAELNPNTTPSPVTSTQQMLVRIAVIAAVTVVLLRMLNRK